MIEFLHYVLIGGGTSFAVAMLAAPIIGRFWRKHYRTRYFPYPPGTMVQWCDPEIRTDHTGMLGTVEAALYFEAPNKIGAEVAIAFVCGCNVMGIPVASLREVKGESRVSSFLRAIRSRLRNLDVDDSSNNQEQPTAETHRPLD